MVSAGYLFERFASITYGAGVFYTALTNPSYFGHLTYWALVLHVVCALLTAIKTKHNLYVTLCVRVARQLNAWSLVCDVQLL